MNSRFPCLSRWNSVPMNLWPRHKQALLVSTTSLRVSRGTRDVHVSSDEYARDTCLSGCLLIIFREDLWWDILCSVWKRSSCLSEKLFSCEGHVRIRLFGFAVPHMNVLGVTRLACLAVLSTSKTSWTDIEWDTRVEGRNLYEEKRVKMFDKFWQWRTVLTCGRR